MNSLLLVTHPRADGKYDSGLLEEKIEVVQEFSGPVYAVTDDRETDLYAQDVYNRVIEDTRGDGLVSKDEALEMHEFEEIYRAGAQYSNCCANTDISIAAQTDEELEFTYLADLTVDEDGCGARILDEAPRIPEYNYPFEQGTLARKFTTFEDLIQRTF